MSTPYKSTLRFNPATAIMLFLLPMSIILAAAITEIKWIYAAAILLAPLLIYLSFKKPFVFPLGIYAFSIPFENLLVMSGAAQGATLTRYLGILAIVSLLLKGLYEKKIKAPGKIHIWWLLFSIYCVISTLWAISGTTPSVRIVTIIGLALLYLVATSYQATASEYKTLKWLIFSGGLLSSVLTIIAYHQGLIDFGEVERVSLMSLDGSGIGGANKQAFDMLLPFSICLGMLFEKGKTLTKGFFLASLLLMFFGIVITGSRGGLAAAIVVLVYFIFSFKNKLKSALIGVTILLASFAATPQFYLDRINRSFASHASGRFDIWHVGIMALKKYWLFGAGLDCFPNAYTEFVNYTPVFMGFDRAPHNIFIGTFVELGIIGSVLFLIALYKHYFSIRPSLGKKGSDLIILSAAFWGILTGGLTQDVIWYKSFWLLWMMILIQKNASEYETGSLENE